MCERALTRSNGAARRRTDAGNGSLMGISFTVLWAICWSAFSGFYDGWLYTLAPPQCSPLRWKRPSKTLRPSFRFQTVLGGGWGGGVWKEDDWCRASVPSRGAANGPLSTQVTHVLSQKGTQREEGRSRPPTAHHDPRLELWPHRPSLLTVWLISPIHQLSLSERRSLRMVWASVTTLPFVYLIFFLLLRGCNPQPFPRPRPRTFTHF